MRWTVLLLALSAATAAHAAPPNVLIILTDDQGHGDFGFTGNPKIRTPNLDRLARESVWLTNFYVSPVCTPTRASLMTGRYNYRTAAIDTFRGRALMHPDEDTIARMFAAGGYRTGIFGKWHLGDNYPLRPIDRGFHDALVFRGGGLRQPANPPDGDGYFNPILERNGKSERVNGYCSDIFAEAAGQFIQANRDRPWLAYLAFNAPHDPYEVPEADAAVYRRMNLTRKDFPDVGGHPLPEAFDADTLARIYGMISNIDDNVGKLLARLRDLKLADNTIVVFFSDNGPASPRFNSGLRNRKTSVYEGGIKTPCLIRWPGQLPAGKTVDRIAAHIDLTPTLLDLAAVTPRPKVKFDGVSLSPLLKGGPQEDWPDRPLFFQWHRGDKPEMGQAFAARSQRWKLVQPVGINEGPMTARPTYQFFDMKADPFEMQDVAEKHPQELARLKADYEAWFRDVSATRGFDPPRIILGSPKEPISLLTRQDWRGAGATWTARGLGHWEVRVESEREYGVRLLFDPADKPRIAHVRLGAMEVKAEVAARMGSVTLTPVRLPAGEGKFEAWLDDGKETVGVKYVEVR